MHILRESREQKKLAAMIYRHTSNTVRVISICWLHFFFYVLMLRLSGELLYLDEAPSDDLTSVKLSVNSLSADISHSIKVPPSS